MSAVNPEKLVPDPNLILVNNPGFELAAFAICKAFWQFANELLHIFFLRIANHENQILHEFLELFI